MLTHNEPASIQPPLSPVYIAAPYAATDPMVRAWNVSRACFLARVAASTYKLAPIVVHPGIAQIYGEEETPLLREMGMRVDLSLLHHVHGANGCLWVLLRDDGTMSDGVKLEVEHWVALEVTGSTVLTGPLSRSIRLWRWSDLGAEVQGLDLHARWQRLAQAPEAKASPCRLY